MRSFLSWSGAFLLLLRGVAAIQYCNVDPVDYTDFCVAVNVYYNETVATDDYHVTISTKFYEKKYGWLGVGAGNYMMHRTLMFVLYPGVEYGSTVLGVRSTTYHHMPQHSEGLPPIRIVDSAFDGTYHRVSFTCYGCGAWKGASMHSASAPWIWASNPYQDADSDDPHKRIGEHAVYGGFFMDMSSATVGNPISPTIDARVSIGATEKRQHAATSNPYFVHGGLMVLAFGLLYPTGALLLVRDVQKHWMFQVATLVTAELGIGYGLYNTLMRGGLAALLGLHQAAGCIVAVLLLLQAYLGWANHVQYLKTKVASELRRYHVGLGRGIYLAGAGNALLGIGLVMGLRWAVGGFCVVAVEVAAYAWFKKRSSAQHEYEPVESDEMKV